MGSLYSVGFNNSSGLAGALGKLAAGDISGITDGGYGNLLVMAANKANLSIAEILADGLNSDNTNELMQAMVDYLGGIYEETKNTIICFSSNCFCSLVVFPFRWRKLFGFKRNI